MRAVILPVNAAIHQHEWTAFLACLTRMCSFLIFSHGTWTSILFVSKVKPRNSCVWLGVITLFLQLIRNPNGMRCFNTKPYFTSISSRRIWLTACRANRAGESPIALCPKRLWESWISGAPILWSVAAYQCENLVRRHPFSTYTSTPRAPDTASALLYNPPMGSGKKTNNWIS